MGEYNGIASDADDFFMVWGDNRDLVQGPGHGPGGHLDPNVYFDRQPAAFPKGVPLLSAPGLLALLMVMGASGALLAKRRDDPARRPP